jgi:hypothetical protein
VDADPPLAAVRQTGLFDVEDWARRWRARAEERARARAEAEVSAQEDQEYQAQQKAEEEREIQEDLAEYEADLRAERAELEGKEPDQLELTRAEREEIAEYEALLRDDLSELDDEPEDPPETEDEAEAENAFRPPLNPSWQEPMRHLGLAVVIGLVFVAAGPVAGWAAVMHGLAGWWVATGGFASLLAADLLASNTPSLSALERRLARSRRSGRPRPERVRSQTLPRAMPW